MSEEWKLRIAIYFCASLFAFAFYIIDVTRRQKIERKRKQEARMQKALETIRDNYGQVCPIFEICEHESCQSSYNAWATASQALEDAEAGK